MYDCNDDSKQPRTEHVFVVRWWRLPNATTLTSGWRGRVDHLGTSERRYISNVGDLCEFILRIQQSADSADSAL